MAAREVSNGSRTVERWTNEGTPGYYGGNPLAKQRDLTPAEAADLAAMDAANAAATNAADLRTKMLAAIDAMVTFSAIANPTSAQQAAQVQRLTRAMTALLRVTLNALDSTDGT